MLKRRCVRAFDGDGGQQGETWNVVVVRSYLCNNSACVFLCVCGRKGGRKRILREDLVHSPLRPHQQ